jgi:hypothetical protein
MIEALIAEPGIDWRRVVTAFHHAGDHRQHI